MATIAGGYLFVGAAARPAYAEASVLPVTVRTPSACICNLYPAHWAFSWCKPTNGEIETAIRQLGLSTADVAPLQGWVEQQLDHGLVGFPGSFLRLEVARQFAARFLRAGPEIRLLGVGLPSTYVAEFLAEAGPGAGEARPGIYQGIASGEPLASGGASLGFEPLGYDYGAFHSFICNSLEKDYVERLQLQINEHGRFNELATCERAVEYTRLDTTAAEPVLWQPWQIIEYPRSAA